MIGSDEVKNRSILNNQQQNFFYRLSDTPEEKKAKAKKNAGVQEEEEKPDLLNVDALDKIVQMSVDKTVENRIEVAESKDTEQEKMLA